MRKTAILVGLALLTSSAPAASQFLEVVDVDQQRFDGPMKSGFMEHASPTWTMFEMRVKNLRGPLGNICVDLLWFDESGFLDGEVACQSAPSSGPDIREFRTVVAPGIPDDAELQIAFRHRTFSRFGERIDFHGAVERRPPAIFLVIGTAISCDTRSDLEYIVATQNDPETRALLFRMVERGRCAAWPEGTPVDILGQRGDYVLARAAGDGVSPMWTLRSSLE